MKGPTAVESKNLLAEHHRALDQHLDDLVARALTADSAELRDDWNEFERELLRHLELEETEIFPGFARHDPAEARALLAEHADIRRTLLEIGLDLDLHLAGAGAVPAFARRLKSHAAREDAALYAWAGSHVKSGGWEAIKRGLWNAAGTGRKMIGFGGRIM